MFIQFCTCNEMLYKQTLNPYQQKYLLYVCVTDQYQHYQTQVQPDHKCSSSTCLITVIPTYRFDHDNMAESCLIKLRVQHPSRLTVSKS